ncbi:MAG: hypothetical protein LM590_12510 [Thermofilum sp.]|jgi:hypothetical protein|nr:hypothetical protein [Thermofilum sp.]
MTHEAWHEAETNKNCFIPSQNVNEFMKSRVLIVTLLSVTGILLFWLPLPRVGDYIVGGYPWNAPEHARSQVIALGVILTAVFIAAIVAINILSRKIDEMGDEAVFPSHEERIESAEEEW